jgi:hypothetical protein
VVGAGQASGGGGRSARVLGADAAGRGSLPMDKHIGRVERDANLVTLYLGGRIGCRDDWAGILGRHHPGLPV